jgi:hypothetical protein
MPCSEFIANIEPGGFTTQRLPDIAMAPDGRFAMAWYYVYAPLVGGNNVTAKFYRNNATPLTSEIYNYLSPGTVTQPKIAMDANSNAVLVWHNVSGKILSQRFDSSGSKNGSVVLVSTNLNVSTYPDVAMDASGNYVVVWQAATTMANNDIRAQRFASNGARLGNIFVVNTYTTNHQTIPDVAMDANGNFAVTWMSVGQDGSVEGVYAQRFNSTGAYECTDRTYGLSCGVHGGNRELRVNSYTSGSQADQSIAMDSNGDFIIVWDGPGADDTYGIYAQRYDSKGNATGSNFRVNDVIAYAQDNPGVAMRNGIFIVTWSKDECDEYGSCDARATAKVYNGATPLTPEFPLSVGGVANTDQFTTSVAMNESAYAVAWSGVTAISGTNEYPDIIVRASVDRSCIQQPPTCIDNDGDGYGNPGNSGCSNGAQTDCNDANINIHPGATEICNGLDDDCDGQSDEGGVCLTLTYYSDDDSDSYIDSSPDGTCSTYNCIPTGSSSTPGNDCNDTNPAINPGATETCDGVDNDCDGQSDEGGVCLTLTYYSDDDSDGYIDSSPDGTCSTYNCIPTGSSSTPGNDCNDTNPAIKPGATETCDGVDNDCDGSTDEGGVCLTLTYYSDDDSDGYIDSSPDGTCSTYNCIPTGSSSTPGNDCNDTNIAVNPGVGEVCGNGIDDNCNNQQDEGCGGICDTDGDNHMQDNLPWCFIFGPLDDCDDNNPNVYTGATEICNLIDDDCDGQSDEGGVCLTLTYYSDDDSDGYIDSSPDGTCSTYNCIPTGSSSTPGNDCNDTNPAIKPGATETCDGVDNDCDGAVDEGNVCCTPQINLTSGYSDSNVICTGLNCIVQKNINFCLNGFLIKQDGISLDCNEHTLTGSGPSNGAGVSSAWGIDNIVVENCIISKFYTGILPGDNQVSLESKLLDNTITNVTVGMTIRGGNVNFTIEGNSIIASQRAMYIVGTGHTVESNSMPSSTMLVGCKMCDVNNNIVYMLEFWGANMSNITQNNATTLLGTGGTSNPNVDNNIYYNNIGGITTWNKNLDNFDNGVCAGNYWGPCTDANGNGFCDLPKTVGTSGEVDNHPLAKPWPDAYDLNNNGMADCAECSDADGDGYKVGVGTCGTLDCDDTNAAIHPGATEVCNGVDDDCDGNVDEGIPSTPTTCGNGTCARTGQLLCQNGEIVDSCVPLMPSTEKCDSGMKDEDCDGSNNEDCACNEEQTQSCGPETDVGECIFGVQTCDINGLWGDCVGAVYPANETCNGLDDDCDGNTDEDYVPTPTSCGVGACIASGELICSNGNETNTCVPGEPTSDANCNGVDENCNGINDDDYVETPTTCGVDLCSSTGTLTCINGLEIDDCEEKPPVTVYYDGDSDEYGSATNTQNVCSVPEGYIFVDNDCNDADATISPGADDICDANHNVIDKDCDATNNGELDCNDFCGDIDGDGYVTAEKYGEWGGIIPTIICPWVVDDGDCNDNDAAVHHGVEDAVCNGVDDNCNGAVDEGYVPTPTSCGVGACARTGQLVCISGAVNNTCVPGTPGTETCNGIDDNCNGVADDLDADSDGMNDCSGADKCIGSVADNIALNPNQYAQNNFATSAFESGPSNDQSIVYNMQNTKGCTCKQIVVELGIGIGQIKKGCAPGIMQKWTGIDQNPDRVAGIGKK